MNAKTNIVRSVPLAVIVGVLLGSINLTAAQQTGRVQITSLNLNDEIMPFIEVLIEGNGIRRELAFKGTGEEYEQGGLVELPVGLYRVTSRNTNYFDFRRASFRIQPGRVTRINVYPLRAVLAQMLTSNGRDRYLTAPKPRYDLYSVPHGPDKESGMLVRYDKKHKRGEYVNYSEAMVSYDALAIYAPKIRFDRKQFTLTAEGNVILEDGTQRIKVNSVTVRFKNGAPEVTTN